jgi:hypothetical protein
MSFLLDDAAFGGQVMIGAGRPIVLGLGVEEGNKKIRGSAFIEGPVQMGKAGDIEEMEATLMVGRTGNIDVEEKPELSAYVKGLVEIDGETEEGARPGSPGGAEGKARTVLVKGTVRINGFIDAVDPKKVEKVELVFPDTETKTTLQVVGDQAILQGNLRIFEQGGEGGNIEVTHNIAAGGNIFSLGGNIVAETGEVISNGGTHVLSVKKDFDISHPTKEGWRLTHACVEGPEAAVYIRGRVTNRTEIELPLYWKGLVDIQSITVNLTPIGAHQDVIVKRWDEKKIYLQAKGGMPIDCFYYIMAERKDTEKLIPEYEGTIEDYPGDNSQRSIVGYHYDVKDS